MNGVGLYERVRALEVATTERQAEHRHWRDRIEERLEDGADRMDELGESAIRQEMALRSLTGLPQRVEKIEVAVSPLPSLMRALESQMVDLRRQWEFVRDRVYYAAATVVVWLMMSGKLSPKEVADLVKLWLGS